MGTGAAHLLRLEAPTISHRLKAICTSALTLAALTFGAFAPQSAHAQAALSPIVPPDHYFRTTERERTGATPFSLVHSGRPNFSIAVADPSDEILTTAAADLARYVQERWGSAPSIVSNLDEAQGDRIVLASSRSVTALPDRYQAAAFRDKDLAAEGFAIERVALPQGHVALLCLGGSSIGARYASIDILRRMTYDQRDVSVSVGHVRDEPYSAWRAIYINDSAHQANNYDPNLVYPVDTYRWSLDKWKRYLDQMAFFRYNVLQIWLVPQMFSPRALEGGGVYEYVANTLRAVARYGRPRGIRLCLTNGINVSVDAGTLLDTLPVYKSMPVYRYLSPNKPNEKELMLKLWDHWSKAIPEVSIWQLFPGDPGGCHEQGCGPETYVDLSLTISAVIKKNNPQAVIDFCPWQFFGWGPSWPTQMRADTARIDQGYRYLVSKIDSFSPDTVFSPNLNDFTSGPPVRGGGLGGGNTVDDINAMHQKGHLVHTWTYFVTEGEGWLNHHDKVQEILQQRDVEARYPIAGGICYTMTPALNLLNQFACSEAFWDPRTTASSIMHNFAEGVFGTANSELIDIFPTFDIGPTVGYTFAKAPDWNPDFAKLRSQMAHNRALLKGLDLSRPARFPLIGTAASYRDDLVYFANLYEENCGLGDAVAKVRSLVKQSEKFRDTPNRDIHMAQAREVLVSSKGPLKDQLSGALHSLDAYDVSTMKAEYRSRHYQIFLDYPTDFTSLLPRLINSFFDAFGADFLE